MRDDLATIIKSLTGQMNCLYIDEKSYMEASIYRKLFNDIYCN